MSRPSPDNCNGIPIGFRCARLVTAVAFTFCGADQRVPDDRRVARHRCQSRRGGARAVARRRDRAGTRRSQCARNKGDEFTRRGTARVEECGPGTMGRRVNLWRMNQAIRAPRMSLQRDPHSSGTGTAAGRPRQRAPAQSTRKLQRSTSERRRPILRKSTTSTAGLPSTLGLRLPLEAKGVRRREERRCVDRQALACRFEPARLGDLHAAVRNTARASDLLSNTMRR